MTIKCDVILDSDRVNEFLAEHGYGPEFGPVAVGSDPEAGMLERNGLEAILLGKNRGGVATVLLCHEMSMGIGLAITPTSLALLEHVVGEMRAAVGEDSRLDGDPAIIEEDP